MLFHGWNFGQNDMPENPPSSFQLTVHVEYDVSAFVDQKTAFFDVSLAQDESYHTKSGQFKSHKICGFLVKFVVKIKSGR